MADASPRPNYRILTQDFNILPGRLCLRVMLNMLNLFALGSLPPSAITFFLVTVNEPLATIVLMATVGFFKTFLI